MTAPHPRPPRETLQALVAEGLSVRQIGARFGVSHTTAWAWLKREGLTTHRRVKPPPSPHPPKVPKPTGRPYALDEAETRAIVERARQHGVTRKDAAKREWVDRKTLHAAMRRYGVEWYE